MSMVLAAVVALNPLGIDLIHAAFFANEVLSRSIWEPIVLAGMAIVALLVLLEWGIRKFIMRRRARGTATLG